jgi:hypothetical protein
MVVRDATLEVDPGVEVQLKPGVNLFVEGQLRAAGADGNPVRFVGNGGRWKSITGQAGGVVTLEQAEIRNAGSDGVAVSSSAGTLNLRNVLLTDGGGGIVTDGSAVDIQGSRVMGNDLRSGPAANIGVKAQTPVTLRGNIFGGNQLPQGTPQVRLSAGADGSGPLAIEGNVFAGGAGSLLELQTASALGGPIRCNGFYGGTIGLQISSSTPDANGFGLVVETNVFEQQTVYGAASTIPLGAGNNWWGDASGPADAQRNPGGRGVRIGVNVGFDPVLQARPECAPQP